MMLKEDIKNNDRNYAYDILKALSILLVLLLLYVMASRIYHLLVNHELIHLKILAQQGRKNVKKIKMAIIYF